MRLDHAQPQLQTPRSERPENDSRAVSRERKALHDRDNDNRLSFRSALEGAAKQENRQNERPQTAGRKDLEQKIETIEKKIEIFVKSGKMDIENEAEPLRNLLIQIKKALAALEKNCGEAYLVSGGKETPFTDVLANMLARVEELLGKKGGEKELAELVKTITAKVDALESKVAKAADPAQMKHSHASVATTAAFTQAAETQKTPENHKSDKVTIQDLRTRDTGEEIVVKNENKKNTEHALALKDIGSAKKAEMPAIKISELPQHLTSDKPADLSGGIKEIQTSTPLVRAETTGDVAVKHYTNFVSTVNKAAMESLLENVASRAFITLKDGKSELKMALTPPELGQMKMKLEVEGGVLSGKIVVSTPEAKQLFDENLGELQRQMQQAGLQIGNLDVSLGNPSGQTQEDTRQASSGGKAGNLVGDLNGGSEIPSEAGWRSWMSGSSINFVA